MNKCFINELSGVGYEKMRNIFRNILKKCLLLSAFFLFTFSLLNIIKIKTEEVKESNKFEKIRQEKETHDYNISNCSTAKKDNYNKYKVIKKENEDFVAWLKIPDTPIDYPVMSTPSNPNYYLRKDFDREYSMSGTPFIGDGIGLNSKVFIVYAHNMKNGTMFGTLEKYKSEDYKEKHKYITLETLEEARTYEVIDAFYINLNENKIKIFEYYKYSGDLNENKMEKFKQSLSNVSIYGVSNHINYDDQIMMLSTCSYFVNNGNGRFVIVTKLIR